TSEWDTTFHPRTRVACNVLTVPAVLIEYKEMFSHISLGAVMTLHRVTSFVAVLALAGSAPAAAQRVAPASSSSINIPFERYTLPNGLTVILSVSKTIPQASVDVWYHVGSKNEVKGRTGFAHLF